MDGQRLEFPEQALVYRPDGEVPPDSWRDLIVVRDGVPLVEAARPEVGFMTAERRMSATERRIISSESVCRKIRR